MNKVQDLGFDGSDNEAYEEDEDDNDGYVENMLRETCDMDLSSEDDKMIEESDEDDE
jgi:hypothetical protein